MSSLHSFDDANGVIAFLRIAGPRFVPIKMRENKSIQCPHCSQFMPERWEALYTIDENNDRVEGITSVPADADYDYQGTIIKIDWMACFNPACLQVIVRIRKHLIGIASSAQNEEWLAIPRRKPTRPIDPIVPDRYRLPYVKASLILEDAPDMSGVLSRRILQNLLKEYAGREEYKLEERIDKFIGDAAFACSTVMENLHQLREIGNFAAHTKENKLSGEIVEINADEAEWTLDVIDGLFDYFIVGPEKNRQRKVAWEQKRGPQNLQQKK